MCLLSICLSKSVCLLSICLIISVCLLSICLSISMCLLSICLSISVYLLSISLSISVCLLSICLSISVCLLSICLSISVYILSISLSISVCLLSICLSISVCLLSICLSVTVCPTVCQTWHIYTVFLPCLPFSYYKILQIYNKHWKIPIRQHHSCEMTSSYYLMNVCLIQFMEESDTVHLQLQQDLHWSAPELHQSHHHVDGVADGRQWLPDGFVLLQWCTVVSWQHDASDWHLRRPSWGCPSNGARTVLQVNFGAYITYRD